MKRAIIVSSAFACAPASTGAASIREGCLKGAAVGGVGGHYPVTMRCSAPVVGCIIGHHEAAKHAHERAASSSRAAASRAATARQSNSGR